ncbi:MAG: aldehyde dehydrogenase family protein [Tuberibacillus sp.]
MESRNKVGSVWKQPKGEKWIIHNPSQLDEEVGVLHMSEKDDVLEAAQAARHAQKDWAKRPATERGEMLFKLAYLLENARETLSVLASREMGKPIGEMRGEVTRGIQILRHYAAKAVDANGDVIPSASRDTLQYTKRVPLGVVGMITPWNFPIAIPLWKMAPALVCGNTIVWKPAEHASLSAVKLTELMEIAGFPDGVLNLIIEDGKTAGEVLLQEADIDAVSFTGSTAVGRHVAQVCAARNLKFQTEMGGKNAAIVWKDADLDQTIPALFSGAFRSAGQKCTATSKIIVHEDILPSLVEKVKDQFGVVKVGHALDEQAYLGPVASKEQYEKVMSYVNLALKDAEIIVRGELSSDLSNGYYVAPLVVSGVNRKHPLVQEEIFGPVTVILRVKSFDEAIEVLNDSSYGLSASLFTNDMSCALRFFDEAEAGMVRVNLETAGVEYQAPFGGMKQSSSHTREQGDAALEFYTQIKTCAISYGF